MGRRRRIGGRARRRQFRDRRDRRTRAGARGRSEPVAGRVRLPHVARLHRRDDHFAPGGKADRLLRRGAGARTFARRIRGRDGSRGRRADHRGVHARRARGGPRLRRRQPADQRRRRRQARQAAGLLPQPQAVGRPARRPARGRRAAARGGRLRLALGIRACRGGLPCGRGDDASVAKRRRPPIASRPTGAARPGAPASGRGRHLRVRHVGDAVDVPHLPDPVPDRRAWLQPRACRAGARPRPGPRRRRSPPLGAPERCARAPCRDSAHDGEPRPRLARPACERPGERGDLAVDRRQRLRRRRLERRLSCPGRRARRSGRRRPRLGRRALLRLRRLGRRPAAARSACGCDRILAAALGRSRRRGCRRRRHTLGRPPGRRPRRGRAPGHQSRRLIR